MTTRMKTGSLYPMRRPKSFDTDRSKENLSQKTAKSLRQESYVAQLKSSSFDSESTFFRRPYKSNTSLKERFSQNTVTLHFKVRSLSFSLFEY